MKVGAKGRQCRGQWCLVGEVELTKDQTGRGAVNEEIIPFERRADRRSEGNPGQRRLAGPVRSWNAPSSKQLF